MKKDKNGGLAKPKNKYSSQNVGGKSAEGNFGLVFFVLINEFVFDSLFGFGEDVIFPFKTVDIK